MDTKGSFIVGASIVIASVILGLTLTPKAPLRSAPAPQIGRFQMGGVPGHAYVIDTTTGEVWEQFATSNEGSTHPNFRLPKIK